MFFIVNLFDSNWIYWDSFLVKTWSHLWIYVCVCVTVISCSLSTCPTSVWFVPDLIPDASAAKKACAFAGSRNCAARAATRKTFGTETLTSFDLWLLKQHWTACGGFWLPGSLEKGKKSALKLSCYCSGWQGDALRSSETSATWPFPVSYVILGKVVHKSYIVHGTARDTWLPSTSHWAFCESVQRPRQAARSRTTYEAVTTATKNITNYDT